MLFSDSEEIISECSSVMGAVENDSGSLWSPFPSTFALMNDSGHCFLLSLIQAEELHFILIMAFKQVKVCQITSNDFLLCPGVLSGCSLTSFWHIQYSNKNTEYLIKNT